MEYKELGNEEQINAEVVGESDEIDVTLTAIRLLKVVGRKGLLSDAIRASLTLYERKYLQSQEEAIEC